MLVCIPVVAVENTSKPEKRPQDSHFILRMSSAERDNIPVPPSVRPCLVETLVVVGIDSLTTIQLSIVN